MSSILTEFEQKIRALQSVSEKERAELLSLLPQISRKEEEDNFKIRRLTKDKSIVVNILNATILDLQKNKTQLEETSNILEQNLKELEFSYQELEHFSYVASHDLKSPLRTITSFAQLLKKTVAPKLDTREKDFLRIIIDGAKQMYDIIDKLLEYSKVSDRNKLLDFIDLNEIMDMVTFNLKNEMEETNTELIICCKLPSIKGYKTNFIQLFQNLIGNAIKFRGPHPPQIKIMCEEHLGGWQFQVRDNGMGINEAYQDKAFAPFQRLHNTNIPWKRYWSRHLPKGGKNA